MIEREFALDIRFEEDRKKGKSPTTRLNIPNKEEYTTERIERTGRTERIERAVGRVLDKDLRTMDIMAPGMIPVGTQAMGDAVVAALAE